MNRLGRIKQCVQYMKGISLMLSWVVLNHIDKKTRKELYEDAVRKLVIKLLDDGVIQVRKTKDWMHSSPEGHLLTDRYDATLQAAFKITEGINE